MCRSRANNLLCYVAFSRGEFRGDPLGLYAFQDHRVLDVRQDLLGGGGPLPRSAFRQFLGRDRIGPFHKGRIRNENMEDHDPTE
jgi:hypothetical protein